MIFSSLIFLYAFLPAVLILGWLSGKKLQNYVLLVMSLIFYAWGGVSAAIIVVFSLCFNYVAGRIIDKQDGSGRGRWTLAFFIAGNLALIVVSRYSAFLVNNLNSLLEILHAGSIPVPSIHPMPGISFFTFHSISYIVDIYRRDSSAQKNIFSMGLYITFFPQLIAGPIIRYHEIADQLTKRRITLDGVITGIDRFITGLVKKVLFSNAFAYPADEIFKMDPAHVDTPLAWFGIVCYSLHIYCDFSGYSDMACGLGKLFGFTFPENFNFPYVARSIQDFWRRWHMTLSRWFRDYVYIPLGGNKKGNFRTYLNLSLVFFLTGLWHGAAWSMIVWGLWHGLFLIIERLTRNKLPSRTYGAEHIYVLLVVMIGWVFFKAKDLDHALLYLGRMFGSETGFDFAYRDFRFYLDSEFMVILSLGLVFSLGIPQWIRTRLSGVSFMNRMLLCYVPLKRIGLILLLIICSLYLSKQGYNPFIYYQF